MAVRRSLPQFLIFAALVLQGGCDSTKVDEPPPLPSGPLPTVLAEAGDFDTFPEAASRAGLGSSIGGSDAATFFIPDDEAFFLMSPETLDGLAGQSGVLERVLLRHVVQGAISLADLNDGDILETAEGTPLSVTVDDEGTVFLDGIRVEEQVGTTRRGRVYRVKSVFRNHLTVEERVAASPLLSHASRLFSRTGVSLTQPGTFLIPINRGFDFYPGGGLASFDDQTNDPLVTRTLQHLVIPDRVLNSDELVAEQSLTTRAGEILRTEEENGVIGLASGLELANPEAKVLARDIPARNGVFHLIERPIQGHLSLWERIGFFDELNLFESVVADLRTTLDQDDGLTVFAPQQSTATDSIGTRGIEQLLSEENTLFRQLLGEFHISPQDIPSTDIVNGIDFPSLAGEDIYVRPNNFRRVTTTVALSIPTNVVDLPAANGRLHLMEDFLNPRSIDPFDQLILSGAGAFRALVARTGYEDFVRGPNPVTVVPPLAVHAQLFQPEFGCRAVEIVEDHLSPVAVRLTFNPNAPPISVPALTSDHSIVFPNSTRANLVLNEGLIGFSPLIYINFRTQNDSFIHVAEAQFRYAHRQNLPPC